MSVIEVSVLAGEILSTLERDGRAVYLDRLTASRRCPRDLIVMALGWLFKEGLVTIQSGIGDWVVAARTHRRGLTARSRPRPVTPISAPPRSS